MNQAMIVAPQPEAVEAGADMLRAGGNAIDAAIACALVQGVVDPLMAGIAGFGSLLVWRAGEEAPRALDFHGRAPAAARPDMWADLIEGEARDGFGFALRGRVNDVGACAITVPGSLKAYYEAQSAFGTRPWAEVVAPAVAEAEAGFVVRPHVHHFWTEEYEAGRAPNIARLRASATGRAIFFEADGSLKKVGARVHNPDLARTLARIADGGAALFYEGEMAAEIDADMRARGGLLSAADLAAYRTRAPAPLRGRYRGLDIFTNNPPGGGLMVLEMLNILEHFDLAGLGHNTPAYIMTVAEAMKRATADKDAFIGDPEFVEVPIARLAGAEHARAAADAIRAGERVHVPRFGADSPHTTHISVIDGAGNAVSMTHSLGMPSGVITDGLGFMYNGCMGVFDPRPGRAGSIAPGKARFSSIAPTIVAREGRPVLIVGAPGGTQIAMGVLQAILNVVDFAMTPAEAVSAPRFSATSDAIDVCNRIPRATERALEAAGYEVVRSPLSYTFAAVHAIGIDGETLRGGADPGHDGMAMAV